MKLAGAAPVVVTQAAGAVILKRPRCPPPAQIDTINDLFVEARDEIDYAKEDAEVGAEPRGRFRGGCRWELWQPLPGGGLALCCGS